MGNRHRVKGKNQYYVYILASRRNGTLYVGVTSELVKRVHGHKSDLVD
jgi:putative endonuclease